MKSIPSSAKERKRYILIKIESERRVEKEDVVKLVIQAGLQFLGELGMARAGIQMVPESWDGQTAIVRTGHKFVDETKAALALVKEFEGKKITISSIKVSGAIDKLKRVK